MLNGQCLCGSVQFQIAQDNFEMVYQCHCSLCRKQSGTHANHATMVKAENFAWCTGQDHISTYKKATGFTSSFCKNCGSPVPNNIGTHPYLWIPLGLIENNIEPRQRFNFCMASKAQWEKTIAVCDDDELPHWDTLRKIFKLDE